MGTTMMKKEEFIALLEGINNQLVKLEKSMESVEYEWQRDQEKRIGECGKRLERLEKKISSIEAHYKNKTTSSLQLTLSF